MSHAGYLCFYLRMYHSNQVIELRGIAYTMPAVDTDVTVVEKMYAVNVFGPMRMVHHFHRMIIAAKGTIVNVGSIGGITPYVYGSAYNGSKAALIHWGATLRVEMLPFGQVSSNSHLSITMIDEDLSVKVVNIISGEVGTNILKNDRFRKLPEGQSPHRTQVDCTKICLDSVYAPMSDAFEAHVRRTPGTCFHLRYD